MQFPYIFQCQYSTYKKKNDIFSCTCTINPLQFIIQIKSTQQIKRFKNYQLEYISKEQKPKLVHVLNDRSNLIYLKFSENSQYNIAQKLFQTLFVLGDYKQYFTDEVEADSLSQWNSQLFMAQNRKTKITYLVRNFYIYTSKHLNELQIIRRINHRCCLKIIQTYLENISTVKVIYQYITGIHLDNFLKKKKNFKETQLEQFTRKLIFFFQELQNKKIDFESFSEQDIILISSKLNYPIIIDFSNAKIINNKNHQYKHIKLLGELLFRLLFNKNCDQAQITKLKKWLNKQSLAYNSYFNIFKKSFFELLYLMLTNEQIKPLQVVRQKWFLSEKNNQYRKLETINSMQQNQEDFPKLRSLENQSTSTNLQQFDENESVEIKMLEHLNKLKVPFQFR